MSDDMQDYDFNNIEDSKSEEAKKFLTFLSDGLVFGVKVDYVTEIITNHTITVLPMVPDFVKGIINLRGQIIPIVDIRLRMNKPEAENYGVSCIIVLSVNSVSIGILVDMVSQVLDIKESEISPPPTNSSRQDLISGIISISDGTVMLVLDCEALVYSEGL